jgi:methylmalonyl-CoA mutase
VQIFARRDKAKAEQCLENLTKAAAGEHSGNLLELAVEAARARCSVGEISDALEKVFGRFQLNDSLVSGVYASSHPQQDLIHRIQDLSDQFLKDEGRRPRILVAKMGQDGHDRGTLAATNSSFILGAAS